MKNYQPQNVLVTGGAGFIGSNFVHKVLSALPQCNIVNLDLLTYAGSLNNLKDLPHPKQHHFVKGDICDPTLVSNLLTTHDIDTIIHFAAESHVDNSINNPQQFIQTNVFGTQCLLEAAKQYWFNDNKLNHNQCRFIHISTDEVYGSLKPTDPPFTEESPYQPNSPYSASKASADHIARAYYKTYDFPVIITHCSNNYGPRQHSEKFIPTIIRSCIENATIPVYGEGKNKRDWIHVDDHCQALLKILTHGGIGEVYNVGGEHEIANLELAKLVCSHFDNHSPKEAPHEKLITFVADRLGHDWRYGLSNTKIARSLAWKPHITFTNGLAETIQYYQRESSLYTS